MISILKKYISKVIIDPINKYYRLILKDQSYINVVLSICKNHSFFQFKVLSDIACVDFFNEKNRFELNYLLLSLKYSIRFVISVRCSQALTISSIHSLYSNAN